jgi:carbamoyltransferase
MHDPAIAIIDAAGRPVFAEASERYLQCKRAYDCPPDDLIRIPELVRAYCGGSDEIVAAVSWSGTHLDYLESCGNTIRLAPPIGSVSKSDSAWPFPDAVRLGLSLRNSVSQAGNNLAGSPQIDRPVLVRRYEHHLCHAASAVYSGPFDECAVAVVDGFGETGSTSFFRFRRGRLERITEPGATESSASLGFFYARLCALCGFDPVKGEEWKVMGLAACGEVDAELYELMRPLIGCHGIHLERDCSEADERDRLRRLRALMRKPASSPREAADLACTGQRVFEETMADLLSALHRLVPSDNLALAGGCALNSAFNGRIVECTPFQRLHVPSAPADDGAALGAAWLAHRDDAPDVEPSPLFASPYLGSTISGVALERLLQFASPSCVRRMGPDTTDYTASLLEAGRIVGWIQGRAEFGPRALGNRSVLADPRSAIMKDRINSRVKFREEYRPFAPAVLDERGSEFFECYQSSPYMERALRFRPEKRALVPAVVHEDGTGRVQSVRRDLNPEFYDLVLAFAQRTGVPILLNTSLNVMGKPIVHSLEDALGMFFTTGLDALVVEDVVIEKECNR